MAFLTILGTLIAERFLLEYQYLRRALWFEHWLEVHQTLPVSRSLRDGYVGVSGLLLPPLLAVALLQWLLGDVAFGIPGMLLAAVVLIYSLGPEDLDFQVSQLISPGDGYDPSRADAIAAELAAASANSAAARPGSAIAEGVLASGLHRVLGPLFWFLVLGPGGALGYRLVREIESLAQSHARPAIHEPALNLLRLLDWVPARMMAGLFALAGNFEPAVKAWHEFQPHSGSGTTAALVGLVGTGALSSEIPPAYVSGSGETELERVRSALGLVWRSVVVFVSLLGLATVSGWLV